MEGWKSTPQVDELLKHFPRNSGEQKVSDLLPYLGVRWEDAKEAPDIAIDMEYLVSGAIVRADGDAIAIRHFLWALCWCADNDDDADEMQAFLLSKSINIKWYSDREPIAQR